MRVVAIDPGRVSATCIALDVIKYDDGLIYPTDIKHLLSFEGALPLDSRLPTAFARMYDVLAPVLVGADVIVIERFQMQWAGGAKVAGGLDTDINMMVSAVANWVMLHQMPYPKDPIRFFCPTSAEWQRSMCPNNQKDARVPGVKAKNFTDALTRISKHPHATDCYLMALWGAARVLDGMTPFDNVAYYEWTCLNVLSHFPKWSTLSKQVDLQYHIEKKTKRRKPKEPQPPPVRHKRWSGT